jgi:hypothetical protein
MTFVRLRTAVPAALALAAAAAFVPGTAQAAAAPALVPVGAGELVPLLATSSDAVTYVGDEAEQAASATAARTATFKVNYTNFSPAAKAAFQRAVNVWSTQVRSSVPIVINASYRPLGTGVLGSAGSNKIWQNNSTKTLYVDALANKLVGNQLDPSADIIANFSSSFDNWYFGTGKAPKGTYDFQSVVTHEIGHGLGFLGGGRVSGGTGSVAFSGFAFGYDKAVENGAGKKILSFPNSSAALKSQLTGGSLFFDSPAVRNNNGGKPARLYAPRTWNQGSSYSHLDEATFRPGNVNSLMTPQLGDGETIRTPGKITKAIFTTIGW